MKLYDIEVLDNSDKKVKLEEYKGDVLLVVNTATGCGFTPQYEGLEKLYRKYNEDGFEILDFPCNQFGNQAPGSAEEIHEFCSLKYDTTFRQFKKIDVNGENESPLFTYLKNEIKDEEVKGLKNKMAMKAIEKISKTCQNKGDITWNFTKFLIDREGNVVKRFAPTSEAAEIEKELKKYI